MSLSSESHMAESVVVEKIFENVLSSSSEEPLMEECLSLNVVTPPDSPKMALFKQGLYKPVSGEICTQYVAMSDSEVLRHSYYSYPGVKNPGILEALLEPEPNKIYSYDGQELYLDLCKQMNVIPVRSFYRNLLKSAIDLKYYGVNAVGVRAMCLALANNRYVRRLDLSSNFLTNDACYHLGQLLGESFALQELILSGCRIQSEGTKRLVVLLSSRNLDLLDLSKNEIKDTGFQYLAYQITKGAVIKRLNLSYNDLSSQSALALAAALENNNTINHLDLSWNKMYPPKGSNDLFRVLRNSKVLTELNMSWNGLTIGAALKELLGLRTLQILDLSNNRLSKDAANAIALKLVSATMLHTLDLSHNPLSPADAFMLLAKMRNQKVKLKNFLMDDVTVTKEFVVELKAILDLDYRKQTNITYGRVLQDYTLSMPDMRQIVMKRIDFVVSRTKKCKLDIALYFLEEFKARQVKYIQTKDVIRTLKLAGAPIDEGLIDEVARAFPGPKTDKGGTTINLSGVVEFIRRLWPDRKLPPTPPPELEPKPEPLQPQKGNARKSNLSHTREHKKMTLVFNNRI